jgi:hypothetical protein
MKSRAIVAASMLMLVSVFAYAINPTESQLEVVTQQSKSILKVIYQGASSGKAVLTVYNQSGEIVFVDKIYSERGFIRPLNFTGMEKGVYKIEVSTSQGVIVKSVEYGAAPESKLVVANEGSIKAVHIAKLTAVNKYLVSVSNQGASKITVRVYDGNKELVYNRKVTIRGDYGVVYNLKDVVGTPSFEVIDEVGKVTVK